MTQILESGDSSCFSVSNPYSVPFYYYVGSDNHLTQCEPSRIWWDESTVEGYGVDLDTVVLNIDEIS